MGLLPDPRGGDPVIALLLICAAVVLIAAGASNRHTRTTILAEVLAVEQRQIERERAAANRAARWIG